MTPYAIIPMPRNRVSDPDLHRGARKLLAQAQGAAITVDQTGQEDIVLACASYHDHLERLATHHILDSLNLAAVAAAKMSDEHAAILEAARPTPDEMAADRWNPGPMSRVGDVFEYPYRFKANHSRERDDIRIQPVVVVATSATRLFTAAVAWEVEGRSPTISMDNRYELTRGGAVAVGEYNHLSWFGPDLRPMMPSVSTVVGRLPPNFLDLIISALFRCRETTTGRRRPC